MNIMHTIYIWVIILSNIENVVYGGYPISDPNAASINGKTEPYNLIDTDPSCFHQGICNMFPPGGELSTFPNSEEKFQHILHNLHRMHVNESLNTSIGKWFNGRDKLNGSTRFCVHGCSYCGTSHSDRKPLYWYSDANQMARFDEWDHYYCDENWYFESGESYYSTCKWGNTSIPEWKGFNNGVLTTTYKNLTYLTGTNRCSLFGHTPNPTSSPTNPTPYNDDCKLGRFGKFCHDRKDRCWFETEGFCNGNECLFDPHCEPVFANKYDYVGKGFVAKMNVTSAVYSRFTKEIYYPLPIAAHFDERVKVVAEDREQTAGKYFVLMLEYFDYNRTQTVLDCYALYDGNYTSMSIYAGDGFSGHSAIFSTNYVPPSSCQPYSFICKTSLGNFFRLPEEGTYYFGTEWIDWDDIDYKNDFGYECKENHYYNHPSQGWTVNGGPTLKKSDIWYYQDTVNYGSCIGCQYISVLQCWEQCIRDNFNPSSCLCVASTPRSIWPPPCFTGQFHEVNNH